MQKYLFRDGTNVIKEVESKDELKALIQSSADPAKIRIWIFNTSEWITPAEYDKRFSLNISPVNQYLPVTENKVIAKPSPVFKIKGWLKKAMIAIVAAAAIFLVYNFTRVVWKKASPLGIMAARPENNPVVNMDSLVQTIEMTRGQKLDKTTRTNLRIRNTWPDLLLLKLNTDRDTSREGNRYHNMELVIDNATGYNIDEAIVKWTVWQGGNSNASDTIRFSNIGYASPAKRKIEGIFKGDSISISFSSIRAKVFNFCYSSDKKSNYGNYGDRWYCK